MLNESAGNGKQARIVTALKPAFSTLLEAFDYCEDTGSDPWVFAVSIRSLRRLGISSTALRWLVRKGYVQHAREVTLKGDNGRAFRSTGDMTFSRRTCFVLTPEGVSTARLVLSGPETTISSSNHGHERSNGAQTHAIPEWNADARVLRLGGQIVKRFKWQALNQEIVLSAFQEDGWPQAIDDPLPPLPDQDPKRRLQDTIKALNRNQDRSLIRFHGNGRGDGVLWEITSGAADRDSS